MTEAIQRVELLCGKDALLEYGPWFSVAQTWPGSTAFLHDVATAPNKDVLLDHLATLRYGLIFRSLGFHTSFLPPTGAPTPDLQITRDGVSTTLEVARFRPTHAGPPILTLAELIQGEWILEPYGNWRRDFIRCFKKVKDKFKQASTPLALIAIWNDDAAIEELEMKEAVAELQQNRHLPLGLQWVVYGSERRHLPQLRELYCFAVRQPLDSRLEQWAREIESVDVRAALDTVIV